MAERIGDGDDAAPVGLADVAFGHRAGGEGPGQSGVQVLHHHVAVDRRPVSGIVACAGVGPQGAGRLVQQVDRHLRAGQFKDGVAEAAGRGQTEGRGVEGLGRGQVRDIDVTDPEEGIPALLTMILMPLTYEITVGIGAGFISWTLIKVVRGKASEVHILMWVVSLLFVIFFLQAWLPAVLSSAGIT